MDKITVDNANVMMNEARPSDITYMNQARAWIIVNQFCYEQGLYSDRTIDDLSGLQKVIKYISDTTADNKLLREENTKCKDLAWEAANEISRLNKEIERLKEQAEKLSFTKCDYCGYEKDLDV